MGIAVLGALEVDGRPSGLSPRDRVVLSAMVVTPRMPISIEVLAAALWGEVVPASWAKVVYGCVWRLRRALGAPAIAKLPSGYCLTLGDDELDHRVFERLLGRARDAMAGDDPERALFLVEEALGLWRGPALPDLEEWEPGRVELARLDGLRMDAEELRVEARTRTGGAAAVLEQARVLVAQAPLRERRWGLLATALYQCGRQGEALGTIRRARAMLAGELGLDPGAGLVQLEQMLLRQDPSLVPEASTAPRGTCPYRGLLPYQASDADAFFGREDEVDACLRRLRDAGILVVIGPSGVGKSSLVRAGVVASLVRAGAPVLAGTPGAHPPESLRTLRPDGHQVLVADQVEEAFTLCDDPAEREAYFAAVVSHVEAGGRLVLSLRADHVGDLAPYAGIARLLEDGLFLLGPMREPQLRRAIEGPAQAAGLRLEPGLVDLIVRDADGEPAGLPMLSHVLRETWERREGSTLTVAGYASTGGIRHAVSQSAERLYEGMDETQRARLRNLLLRLVVPTDSGDPVRTRMPTSQVAVDAVHVSLVEELVEARLVSIDADVLQIAHEALVRVWPRLRGWLEDDVEGQHLLRHLADSAEAWESLGRPVSDLYRGARLRRALDWRERARPDLSEHEEAFLTASAARVDQEAVAAQERARRERRAGRRLRRALIGAAALALGLVVAATIAVLSSHRAEREQDRARAAADLAAARRAGSVALGEEDRSRSLLLALAALHVDDSAQGWDTLAAVMMRSPRLVSLRDTHGLVVDLTASPDGSLIAASRPGEGSGLLLLDARTLRPRPFADDTPASGIAFSPDGHVLAMAVNQWTGNDGSPSRIDPQPVRLYTMPDGRRAARQLGGFPAAASVEYALDFSADGTRLVAAVDRYDAQATQVLDTAATVWDLAEPERPVLRVPVAEYPVLELSPDGDRLYVAESARVRVLDVRSGRELRAVRPATRGDVGRAGALAPDGSVLAVTAGRRIMLLDTRTLRPAGPRLEDQPSDVVRLEYSRDGARIAAATGAGSLHVWDARTGDLLHRFADGGAAWGFDFSADGATIHSAGGSMMSSWDLTGEHAMFATGKASDGEAYDVSVPAPDGHTLLRTQGDATWFVDDGTGRTTPRRAGVPDRYAAWSPDSERVVSWHDGGALRLWDTASGDVVAVHPIAAGAAVAFTASGEHLVVNDMAAARVLLLDAATLEDVREPIELGRPALGIAPHPVDGSVLAVTREGGVLRVDPGTGTVRVAAPAGTFAADRAWEVELSPDGSRMLGPDHDADDAGVRLVDTTTWTRIGRAAPADERIGSFDLAPDGSQFAALGPGGIGLYDGRTGARQVTLPLPDDPRGAVLRYSPDSTRLVVSDTDGRTWTVPTRREAWVDRACDVAGRDLTAEEWREHFGSRAYRPTCPQWS